MEALLMQHLPNPSGVRHFQAVLPPISGVLVAICIVVVSPASAAPANPSGSQRDRIPVRLEIPAVGIDAPVEPIGLSQDSALNWAAGDMAVGWYSQGFRPGEPGNAVLVGHLRTHEADRPGGLWRLDEVKPGNDVVVTMSDGDPLRYLVTAADEFDAHDRPLARLFGKTASENLNIITHSYQDERGMRKKVMVVFSSLDASQPSLSVVPSHTHGVSPAIRSPRLGNVIAE